MKKSLPIGISEYRKAVSKYYYIDKTLLIKELIDEGAAVSLFTRPRRFGKTLNMDMLREFFEISDEDTAAYFRDKQIWSQGEEYQKEQGKYPVVFVSFKDIKCSNWEETYALLYKIIRSEFLRHSELRLSEKLDKYDKEYIERILGHSAEKNDLTLSFRELSRMLHIHHGVPPVIIIDEYDIPIQQGHMKGFYDDVVSFIRNLFSGGLKDNRHLSYGILTGILRVAKESIFSGLNNLKINSILDEKYSQYFGFTASEVRAMAAYYGVPDKYDEICQWYDGYRFGDTDIFNPWSVINYFNNNCKPKAFWQFTGSNDIIGEVLANADEDIYERLNMLMQGKSFLTYVDTGVIYPQIQNNPSTIYSFLLVAGYLKSLRSDSEFGSDYMCEVAIPNKEISFVYSKEILSKLDKIIPSSTAIAIQEAIYAGNSATLQKQLHKLLLQSASYHDTTHENFYHGLVLGLCAMFDNRYDVTSNRESGEGRYDIQLFPLRKNLPGILIELKAAKGCSDTALDELAQNALQQINDRKYDTEMLKHGVDGIIKYGVAFCGKKVSIATSNITE
ncbi:MAG: AAA family ATPase [Oscillospiraceae bacterium]|nr:AAA family ATPase [Oscillospiraceae bacterium]